MKKILEIGSGQGFHLSVLARDDSNEVIGIDLSRNDLKISKERYPNLDFRYMNAEKLKFKKNTFDEIYALDVLEHVDNLNNVLNEITRVLKPGGKFIINIPYHKSERWLLKVRPTFHKEIHHVRIFGEKELESLLKKKKYKLVKKERKEFLQHIELYVLFRRKIKSKTQLSIGSWRDTSLTKFVHIAVLYTNPAVLKTPLVYFPIWIITLPIGSGINFIANKKFPRSLYYIFEKK